MTSQDPAKILVAAAIGFAAGILLAPRSGKETREQIRLKAADARAKAQEVAKDVRHKAEVGKDKAASLLRKTSTEPNRQFEE